MPSRPGFYFFPADWRSDPTLAVCSEGSRYLWFEMLLVMTECQPRGYLLVNGKSPGPAQIAAVTRTDPSKVEERLAELEANGVLSRTGRGVLYSRKMVREEKRAASAKENGKKGGNPTLRKQKGNQPSDNQNPTDIPYPTLPDLSEVRVSPTGGVDSDPRAGAPDSAAAAPAIGRMVERLYEATGLGTTSVSREDLAERVEGWVRLIGVDLTSMCVTAGIQDGRGNILRLIDLKVSDEHEKIRKGGSRPGPFRREPSKESGGDPYAYLNRECRAEAAKQLKAEGVQEYVDGKYLEKEALRAREIKQRKITVLLAQRERASATVQ